MVPEIFLPLDRFFCVFAYLNTVDEKILNPGNEHFALTICSRLLDASFISTYSQLKLCAWILGIRVPDANLNTRKKIQ